MRTWITVTPWEYTEKPVYTLYEEDTLKHQYNNWDKKHLFSFEVWLDGWQVSNWAVQLQDSIVEELYSSRRATPKVLPENDYANG